MPLRPTLARPPQETLGTGTWVQRPRDLTAAIDRLLNDRTLTQRAAELRRELATERGPEQAADRVEAFLAARQL